MSSVAYLRDLLRPLGVYRLEGGAVGAELASQGAALDDGVAWLEELGREMLIPTAEGEGLDKIESLLSRRPVTVDLERRRAALAALLRVGGDSFTLADINDNLKGCGLIAQASECKTPGTVEVRFPDVPGIPDGFDEMQKIIEDILPAHLNIIFVFWYITWAMMEVRFGIWSAIEATGLPWVELEKLVGEETV